jgi:hypothetical protein
MRLRQGGRFHAFAQKCCTKCNIFVQKKKRTMLPQAVCVSSGETISLIVHRVSRVSDNSSMSAVGAGCPAYPGWTTL